MVVLNAILQFFIQLLSNPSILIALFVMVGLKVKKKAPTEIITSVVKTILGFHLISSSATVIISSITPLGTMTSSAFGFTGIVPSNEACFGVAEGIYGSALSGIIVLAMLVNLVIAKYTKFSFVYLTGHEMMWISTACAFIFTAFKMPLWQVIVAGGLVTGLYMAVFPSFVYKDVSKITESKGISIAHTGSCLYWVAARVAALTGDKNHSTEEMNVPKSLAFLKDWNVALSLVMLVLYIIVSLIVMVTMPDVVIEAFGEGTNFIVGSINNAFDFTTGVFILMAGVRLVVGEIVPAFQGISQKFIPGAVASLDIPIVYPYYTTGTLVGFLLCIVAFIAGFLVNIAINHANPAFPVVLPNVVNAFYYGATYACVANPNGGRRGAIIATLIVGFITQFVPAFMIMWGGVVVEGTTFGGADTALLSIILNSLGKLLGGGLFTAVLAIFVVTFIVGVILKKNEKKEEA